MTTSMAAEQAVESLKVDTEAIRVRIVSEPYVTYTTFGYQPAVDVLHLKKRRQMRLFLSARTLGNQLEAIRIDNDLPGLTGIEVWIHKESSNRQSRYVVTES